MLSIRVRPRLGQVASGVVLAFSLGVTGCGTAATGTAATGTAATVVASPVASTTAPAPALVASDFVLSSTDGPSEPGFTVQQQADALATAGVSPTQLAATTRGLGAEFAACAGLKNAGEALSHADGPLFISQQIATVAGSSAEVDRPGDSTQIAQAMRSPSLADCLRPVLLKGETAGLKASGVRIVRSSAIPSLLPPGAAARVTTQVVLETPDGRQATQIIDSIMVTAHTVLASLTISTPSTDADTALLDELLPRLLKKLPAAS
jgi:hypothetical protein